MAGEFRVLDVVNETVADLQKNAGGYVLCGLGFHLALFPLVGLAMIALLGSMVPGILAEDDTMLLGGLAIGFGAFAFLLLLVAPLQAGMYRAVWENLVRDEPLGFGSVFRYAFTDLGAVIFLQILAGTLMLVGALLCYVPALIVSLFLGFALPALVAHRLGPVDAVSLSVAHVKDNASAHVGYWAVGLVVGLLVANVPFVGILLLPALASFQMRCYRRAFGDGELPELAA